MHGYLIPRPPVLPLLSGISLAIGLVVPSIFELGQRPAARHRHPGLELAAIIVLAATAAICLAIALLRKPQGNQSRERSRPGAWQFGLLQLLVAITVLAVALAIVPLLESWLVSSLIVAIIVALSAWAFRSGTAAGCRMGTLLACMFFPFGWLIAYSVPFGRTSGLIAAIPIAPGIFAAELLRGLAGLPRGKLETIAALAVVIQLFLGAWLAQQGPRGSLAYILLVLAASSAGSLVLHILYRA